MFVTMVTICKQNYLELTVPNKFKKMLSKYITILYTNLQKLYFVSYKKIKPLHSQQHFNIINTENKFQTNSCYTF